jgi:hypothetical protein
MRIDRCLLVLAAAALLLSAGARAQTGALSELLRCTQIERDTERLACYDRILAGESGGDEAAREAGPAAAASPRPEPAPAAQIEVPAPRGSASAASRSDAPPPAERGAASPANDGGERQVTIVEVRTTVPGRAVFVTSAGDQYVQTSGRMRLFLPEVPFEARLRPGSVGGMFITPVDSRTSIRVAPRN